MKLLIQRVSEASVTVDDEVVGRIDRGLLAFVGVERGDTEEQAVRLAERMAGYRIFGDETGRMNLSLVDVGGAALVVSQFTLCASTRKGRRPGFDRAAPPEEASVVVGLFCDALAGYGVPVEQGRFGAMMHVSLVNDGPVTFLLEARPRDC